MAALALHLSHPPSSLASRPALLVLGLGGGTIPEILYRLLPTARIHVLEIVQGLDHLAKRYFGLPRSKRLRVIIADALRLQECTGLLEGRAYDAILMDIDSGVPDGAEAETARSAKDQALLSSLLSRLKPGGLCAANLSRGTADGGGGASQMRAALQQAGADHVCVVAPRVPVGRSAAAVEPGVVVVSCAPSEASRRLHAPPPPARRHTTGPPQDCHTPGPPRDLRTGPPRATTGPPRVLLACRNPTAARARGQGARGERGRWSGCARCCEDVRPEHSRPRVPRRARPGLRLPREGRLHAPPTPAGSVRSFRFFELST
ncbi:S-adenosyl-L-methionine-dependent methyltransferase [Baffinella frigidus]|nr:S-adenosyl-L-methionine-dependent methyltransferase [Cryptophyta sp. CCMP2293]